MMECAIKWEADFSRLFLAFYPCCLILYCGWLSSLLQGGKLRHTDVVLATFRLPVLKTLHVARSSGLVLSGI